MFSQNGKNFGFALENSKLLTDEEEPLYLTIMLFDINDKVQIIQPEVETQIQ